MVMAASVIFEVGLSAVSIILGLKLGPRAGLGTPLLAGVERHFPDRSRTRRAIALAVVFGIASAAAIIASAEGLHAFMPSPDEGFKSPAPFASFLGSIGAGIRTLTGTHTGRHPQSCRIRPANRIVVCIVLTIRPASATSIARTARRSAATARRSWPALSPPSSLS